MTLIPSADNCETLPLLSTLAVFCLSTTPPSAACPPSVIFPSLSTENRSPLSSLMIISSSDS